MVFLFYLVFQEAFLLVKFFIITLALISYFTPAQIIITFLHMQFNIFLFSSHFNYLKANELTTPTKIALINLKENLATLMTD